MRAIRIWSLRCTADGTEGARSFLIRDGADTGIVVPGCILEAQYSARGETLLFITHDIPFEECLEIILLTDSGTIADRASLSGAYATGNFRDAKPSGPDTIEFEFFGGHCWRVRLLPRPSFRLPMFSSEPAGVHRPFGWTRKFIVEAAR